ncbi:SKI/SNO/DAC family domain-containing protein [Ditylenchus destructor]|uniref:SKI/SNO/DAC family domain-containing protein n=1 Tax=Ditylenchus destructor TaxID=166010 RepID=A0AAD4QZ17_9BILA|nr:SKI/SNO/DAC family domain-containing protein [Ditylenchus destructor]
MHASGEQLQVLKLAGVIPSSAPKCELITKSNAERLMAVFLVDGTAPPLTDEAKEGIEFIYFITDYPSEIFLGKLYNSLSPQPCIDSGELLSPQSRRPFEQEAEPLGIRLFQLADKQIYIIDIH